MMCSYSSDEDYINFQANAPVMISYSTSKAELTETLFTPMPFQLYKMFKPPNLGSYLRM